MKRKSIYILLCVVLIIIVVGGILFKKIVFLSEDNFSYIVKKILEIEKSNNSNIIVKVDGIFIYKKDFDIVELYEKF